MMVKPSYPKCSCSCEQNTLFDHLVMLLAHYTTHEQIAEIIGEGNFQCKKLREEDGVILLGAIVTTKQYALLLESEYGMSILDYPGYTPIPIPEFPEIPPCSCDKHRKEETPRKFSWYVSLDEQFTSHEKVAAVIGEGNFRCHQYQSSGTEFVLNGIYTTRYLAKRFQRRYKQEVSKMNWKAIWKLLPKEVEKLPSSHVNVRAGEITVLDWRALLDPDSLFDRCSE